MRRRLDQRRLRRSAWLAPLLLTTGLPHGGQAPASAAELRVPVLSAVRPMGPAVRLPLQVAPGPRWTGLPPTPDLPPPTVGPRLVTRGPNVAAAAAEAAAAPRPAQVEQERRRRAVAVPDRRRAAAAPAPTARAGAPASRAGRSGPPSLQDAVARIPGTRAESARWVRRAYAGHWGATDWYANTIYISPRTPPARLYSVVVHEWSHLLQVRAYGGDVDAAVRAMNRHFGGTGLVGAERAADCMTLLQGGTWTHYTSCRDASWRRAAARLVQGRPL